MKTDLFKMAFVALAVASSSVQVACGGTGAGLDIETLPPNLHGAYRRFASRCAKCHSLSRPLTAPVTSVDHWVHYLARMKRQPGSGINNADAELILEFLSYYTTVMQGHGAPAEPSSGSEALERATAPAGGTDDSSSSPHSSEPAPASPAVSEETSDAM